jgi:putative oxidoreductase
MEAAAPSHAPLPSLPRRAARLYGACAGFADRLQPLVALALRLYVARVFFNSGLVKVGNWFGTLGLFENEYHVPLLPPHLAAVLGTAAELGLPVFLALGLGTRAAALALFVFNIVAVVSYPDLSDAGFRDHCLWGTMLAVTFFYGPGRISLDAWLHRKFGA